MLTFSQSLLGNVAQVSAALDLEPGIRLDFTKADLRTVVRVMYAVMMRRSIDAAGLHRHLEARGCRFDRDTVDFLLNAYEGPDPDHHFGRGGTAANTCRCEGPHPRANDANYRCRPGVRVGGGTFAASLPTLKHSPLNKPLDQRNRASPTAAAEPSARLSRQGLSIISD